MPNATAAMLPPANGRASLSHFLCHRVGEHGGEADRLERGEAGVLVLRRGAAGGADAADQGAVLLEDRIAAGHDADAVVGMDDAVAGAARAETLVQHRGRALERHRGPGLLLGDRDVDDATL